MRKIQVFFISFLLLMPGFLLAQKRELRAYLDTKQFYAPGVGNYVEFHLQFVGSSVNYVGLDNGLTGELAVQITVTKDKQPYRSNAYRLTTPFMKDSIVEDFYDIQRFQLDPGNYELQLTLQDINSKNEPLLAAVQLHVEPMDDGITISDIMVAEYARKGDPSSVFYKSGYEILPRLSTFYPQELTTIPVYFEIYNACQLGDSVFGIKQSVVDIKTGIEVESLTTYSRHTCSDVVPVLRSVPIDEVVTGKYALNFTMINRNMTELSSQSYEFERSNDIETNFYTKEIMLDPAFQASLSDDSVRYYLTSLIPISQPSDVRNIIDIYKSKDLERGRKYIQLFWTYTAPENSYEGWIKYKQQVQLVERLYRTNFQNGFETDRGRVYLQYGSPNDIITKENSPNEYPYEIWLYNKIDRFSNKRFVFYNPDLVNNTYRLLHSDMLGEIKNPAWPRDLVKRSTDNGNVDDPNQQVRDHFGGNSNNYYRQY